MVKSFQDERFALHVRDSFWKWWSISYYSDVIMIAMASRITGVSTVCSGADQKNIKAPRHWPSWGDFNGDRWIILTKGK